MWAIVGGWVRLLLRWKAEVVAARGDAEVSAPGMEVVGRGNVQIGHAGGNVTVIQFTQHLTARAAPVADQVKPRRFATDQHRDVLRLMRELPDEGVVLTFMQREFGTRRVVDLSPRQLVRVQRYAEVVLRNAASQNNEAPAQAAARKEER